MFYSVFIASSRKNVTAVSGELWKMDSSSLDVIQEIKDKKYLTVVIIDRDIIIIVIIIVSSLFI